MNFPGFTAESALTASANQFRLDRAHATTSSGGVVIPQLNFCTPCRGTQRVCCSVDLEGRVSCHSVPCLMPG